MPNLTTFFFSNASFTGSGQLNMGPEFLGFVNKIFKVQVRGQINYQGASLVDNGIFANRYAWGVQQVPHTAAAEDMTGSVDSETWIFRRQVGWTDTNTAYAPTTDTGAFFVTQAMVEDWHGQLAVGLDTDIWACIKATDGSTIPPMNAYGTVRVWWG